MGKKFFAEPNKELAESISAYLEADIRFQLKFRSGQIMKTSFAFHAQAIFEDLPVYELLWRIL